MGAIALEEVCQKIKKQIQDAVLTKDTSTIQASFEEYEEYVKSFFLQAEAGIRSMYDYIRTHPDTSNMLTIYCLETAEKQFETYLDGFQTFVSKLADLQCNDQVNPQAVKEKLAQIDEKNQEFMQSIFGGERNQASPCSIDAAAHNVEMMIGLKRSIKIYSDKLVQVIDILKARDCTNDPYGEDIKRGVMTFADTITMYLCNVVGYIIKTYETIQSVIQSGGRPVGGKLSEEKVFRIF